VGLLSSVFHPDVVWSRPKTPTSHDPTEWRLVLGRYGLERWGSRGRKLFDTRELVHNRREARKIEVSQQGNGTLAVVDIGALWRGPEDDESH
jgi:hypothetical protein